MLKISKVADKLNGLMGKDMVRFAAMEYSQPWRMRQGYLSQRYTTRINEVTLDSRWLYTRISITATI